MLEQAGRPPRLVVKDLPVPVPGPGVWGMPGQHVSGCDKPFAVFVQARDGLSSRDVRGNERDDIVGCRL